MVSPLLAAAEYGSFINGFLLLPVIVLAMPWLRLMTWADKDAVNARLPRETINAINMAGFAIACAMLVLVPNFFGALGVFILIMLAEAGIYLGWRNKTVGVADLKVEFAEWLRSFGREKKDKAITADEGNVVLIDKSGKPIATPADDDPTRPAFDAVQSLLRGPFRLGAQRIDLRPNEGGSVQRYVVDGVTLEGKSIPKDQATAAVEYVKDLAGLDVADRRKPQKGKFKIGGDKAKHDVDAYTAGSTAGELLRLTIDFKKQFDFNVDNLGFLPDQLDSVTKAITGDPSGVVLLTAPDQQGQTNLAYALLRRHDAFLSHIQTLEREPQIELESISQNSLANNAPAADESKQIEWMISQQPDVVFLDRCDDPRSAIDLAKYAAEGKRAYIAMRQANTFDALAQWRKLVGDDGLAMKSLKMIVAERLVRVLCPACKVGYTPDPDSLKKMNMSPDRVSKLYQARKEPMRDPKGNEVICPFCHGLAYKGRTGVFELFKIDDEVRKVVTAGGNTNQLKTLFRKQKQRYLQETALARVELGDTSVEEVLRVLRNQASTSTAK
ncbi:MAG TPA: ATPase, T2SS/T4P/T4SS family [Tepidisphaeraceae bacterium]|jgi:general secretion pathway protein E